MIERNDSDLDVDRLVSNIQDATRADAARTIRKLLATAEQKSEIRASWPSRFDFFPFTNARVQAAFLRSYAFFWKDQRQVNLSLVEATRMMLASNEALRLRVEELEAAASREVPKIEPESRHDAPRPNGMFAVGPAIEVARPSASDLLENGE